MLWWPLGWAITFSWSLCCHSISLLGIGMFLWCFPFKILLLMSICWKSSLYLSSPLALAHHHSFSTSYVIVICSCSVLSHVWLFVTQWTIVLQIPLSMEFSRQEYWNGLPFPSVGDLLSPGIEPALAGGFFITSTTWEALFPTVISYKELGKLNVPNSMCK